jgi:hypothetical protein
MTSASIWWPDSPQWPELEPRSTGTVDNALASTMVSCERGFGLI